MMRVPIGWPMVAVCFLLGVAGASAESVGKREPLRVYSDICLNEQSGDLHGTRIIILRLPEGYYAFFQDEFSVYGHDSQALRFPKPLAPMDLPQPQAAVAIVGDNNSDIEILYAEPNDPKNYVHFKGKMTDKMLTGRYTSWSPSTADVQFPRVDVWRRNFPRC